ncbi:hypothetical protein [Thomasclavelia sp.]
MDICDHKIEVYQNILSGKNIDCFIANEENSFFEMIEECEKRLETRQIESFDIILLKMIDKNIIKSWYALEQLQIGEYTQTIGVMDIPPHSLLDIIKNCYLKPVFYYGREYASNLKIKNICEQYGIVFMNNELLKID